LGFGAIRAGRDLHLIGHGEHTVKAHAKLPDQIRGDGLAFVLQGLEEFDRARVGDGPQVDDQLVARHANAGIADRDGLGLVVYDEADRQLGLRVEHVPIGEHLELDAMQRVGCVRDQLAQKDFAVTVKRVRQNVQKLLDFGLEFKRLRCSFRRHRHASLE